ncbi:MAG: hypothetical protein A2Y17_12895 [Clostridiales bacterium GWF2_38_85]|nr:MAG: hypothetical protein A2Y17_12895 [Clostridiales bacterium GWF2_38_85]HBL84156.1 hypothetical protein [Clostridiales bacterium]
MLKKKANQNKHKNYNTTTGHRVFLIEDMVTDNNGIEIIRDKKDTHQHTHNNTKKRDDIKSNNKSNNFNKHFSKEDFKRLPKKKKKRFGMVWFLFFIIFMAVFAYSIIMLIDWGIDSFAAKKEYESILSILNRGKDGNQTTSRNLGELLDISECDIDYALDDIENLNNIRQNLVTISELNDDFYSWVQISNTNVDYPVVQTDNNSEYLSKTYGGRENTKSGAIFADYRCSKDIDNVKHLVLYGHNMTDRTMFGSLKDFFNHDDRAWKLYNESTVRIYTLDAIYIYEPFSIYATTKFDNYVKQDFASENEWINFLIAIYDKGVYYGKKDMSSYIKADTHLITLSTCTNYSANYSQQRFVLHAILTNIILLN